MHIQQGVSSTMVLVSKSQWTLASGTALGRINGHYLHYYTISIQNTQDKAWA